MLGAMYEEGRWQAPEIFPEVDDRWQTFTIDTETRGTDVHGKAEPVGFVLGYEDGQKHYFPFNHLGGGNLDRGRVANYFNSILKGKTVRMTESKFDIRMLRKGGVDLERLGCKVKELQFRFALLDDNRRSFKLDDLAKDYLGKEKLKINHELIADMPASQVGPYAEKDIELTEELFDLADGMIRSEELDTVAELEDDIIYAVLHMEDNGVLLHLEMLRNWIQDATKEFRDLILFVYEQTGLNVNPNSAKDLVELFNVLKLSFGLTEKGAGSFTDAFLKTLDHIPVIEAVRRARTISSIQSKYLEKYYDEIKNAGGILRYKLHQLKGDEFGTISGRFSSSSVNIQQVFDPERQEEKFGSADYIIRELFIPHPGSYWCKADASQIEFRLFAHYSKSAKLIKAYQDNPDIDFHDIVKDILARKVATITRKRAKNTNFGMVYAMGRGKMARQLDLPQEDADELFDAYNAEFPEVKRLLKRAMDTAEERGYVKTILGRRARFPHKDRLHSALNRVIQGTAADILKLKLKHLYQERKSLGINRLLFTVHDEFDMEVDSPDRKHEIKEFLDRDLGLGIRVPLTWEVKCGTEFNDWAGDYKGRKDRSAAQEMS